MFHDKTMLAEPFMSIITLKRKFSRQRTIIYKYNCNNSKTVSLAYLTILQYSLVFHDTCKTLKREYNCNISKTISLAYLTVLQHSLVFHNKTSRTEKHQASSGFKLLDTSIRLAELGTL